MRARIGVGDLFPDVTLPDHRGRPVRLADMTAGTGSDEALGFAEGYPLVVVFYRGFF